MDYELDDRLITYFLQLAEELHFGRAAERLNISQPALSRQIRELEERLGFSLFERHNRKVNLSLAGTYLQPVWQQQQEQRKQSIQHARMLAEGKAGELRFGFVGSAMQEVIPKLLTNFEKQHPNVLMRLNELDNQSQFTGLLKQTLDIGFVRTEYLPKGLEQQEMHTESFVLVVPASFSGKLTQTNAKSRLEEASFILFDPSYSESYYRKVMQIFEQLGFSPKVSHSTVNAATIFRLVENGLGLSIVPESLQYGFSMQIKFLKLDWLAQKTTLKMIWNPANTNPVMRAWLENQKKT
jgi:DNA-binding transcriptional LysR family regulator